MLEKSVYLESGVLRKPNTKKIRRDSIPVAWIIAHLCTERASYLQNQTLYARIPLNIQVSYLSSEKTLRNQKESGLVSGALKVLSASQRGTKRIRSE